MSWDVLSLETLWLGTFCLCTNSVCTKVENSQEVDSGFCLNCLKKVNSKSGSLVWSVENQDIDTIRVEFVEHFMGAEDLSRIKSSPSCSGRERVNLTRVSTQNE